MGVGGQGFKVSRVLGSATSLSARGDRGFDVRREQMPRAERASDVGSPGAAVVDEFRGFVTSWLCGRSMLSARRPERGKVGSCLVTLIPAGAVSPRSCERGERAQEGLLGADGRA